MYFHGARFSNYEAWLSDPVHIKPSAQVVWPVVGQEILNGDVGGGFQGIQITSGFFQLWRASGITSELQLYSTAIGGLVMAAAMFFAGWFHYHKAAPKLEWFQNVESMLNHHLAGLLGLGSLGWAGHQIHISLPVNKLLDAGVDPKEIPLPHDFIMNRQIMADLYPSFGKGLAPFFTLQWNEYSDFLTFNGGLNPVTGGLWLSDTAHHHVAIAVLFLVAGHMYRTNWGIGHSIKEILESHKGPFTGEGHVGLYEILTTSWHAQLAINLALFGSLSIIVACFLWVTLNPTICWDPPFSKFKEVPTVLVRSFLSVFLILWLLRLSLSQTLSKMVSKEYNIPQWNNLFGRSNQQETKIRWQDFCTNFILGSSETLRGTFVYSNKKKNSNNLPGIPNAAIPNPLCALFPFTLRSTGSTESTGSKALLGNIGKTRQGTRSLRARRALLKSRAKPGTYNFLNFQKCSRKHRRLSPPQKKFLEWFLGFTEGDGSFGIYNNRLVFVINQADIEILRKIRKELGFGVVFPYDQNGRIYARYFVSKKEHIFALIQLFNGNIHFNKVHKRFTFWVDAYNKNFLSVQNRIVVQPVRSTSDLSVQDGWISGLFDAEGGFYAGLSITEFQDGRNSRIRLRLKAYVDQKAELLVFEKLATLFSIPTVTTRNSLKQTYRVECSTKKSLLIILEYFAKYKLRSKKHLVYAMWRKLVYAYLNDSYKKDLNLKQLQNRILRIQRQNALFKETKTCLPK